MGRKGTHQQRRNLMEDVDGLLGGLLFFGAVVGAGHFESAGGMSLFWGIGLNMVGDVWWLCLFFFRCGGGDACVWWFE